MGTFVAPLNVNESYGDGMLLFTIHRITGSAEDVTENLIKERCFVHTGGPKDYFLMMIF